MEGKPVDFELPDKRGKHPNSLANLGRNPKYTLEEKLEHYNRYIKKFIDNAVNKEDLEVIPTIEGLALSMDVTYKTVNEWCKKQDSFSDAVERLMSIQKLYLVNGSLKGGYNGMIARLLLSNNHGVNEKTETQSNQEIKVTIDQEDAQV